MGWEKLVLGHYTSTFYCHMMSIDCHGPLQGHFLLLRVEYILPLVITQSLFIAWVEKNLPRAITRSLFIDMGWVYLPWVITRSLFIATGWVYLAMSCYKVTFYCNGLRNTCHWSLHNHFLLPWVKKNLTLVITQSLFIATWWVYLATGHYKVTFYCHGWVYLATGQYKVTFYWNWLRKLATGHYTITFYSHLV